MPMKKIVLPFFVAMTIILVVIAGYLATRLIIKYTPSKELQEAGETFQVSENQVALLLNEELQEAQGIFEEGQTYLPVSWVNDKVNERFYWDSNEKILVYTLPDQIVYADESTIGSTGKPLIKVAEDQIYLSLGLVLNYTDIRVKAFDEGEIKRVFINDTWEPENMASLKKDGKLRTSDGIKNPIIAPAIKGELVKVMEQGDTWSWVSTEDGYLGYIENKMLKGQYSEKPTSSFTAPVYTSISLGEKINLVWHQVTTMEANKSLENMLESTKGVNVVSPTWFALADNKGNFTSLASTAYVETAHSKGLQVWALLSNFSKDVQSHVLFATTSTRRKLIDGLVKEVETYDIDGINLDIETIREEAGVHYVQFIRELSVICREKGIVLSVDNHVPMVYNQFYNLKEQGIVADYIIIMGYDERTGGDDPGSVASLGYVEKGITDTLLSVPKEKVINAVPFFTRLWTVNDDGTSSSPAYGIAKAKNWISENEVHLDWKEELGQYYGELVSEKGKQMLWMEDEKSLGLKMDLIRKYDLEGVACWKLGLETPEIWDIISP